ncbi:MAG: glycosyltransferase family 4 protein [Acetobacteraceae bacterium]|nr:glycosyltransferase family 4 protein [Acetobacteraceae bacterium]
MKILFHHRVASRDGQAVHIEELIHALRAQGHEVRVAAPSGWDQTGFGASNPAIDAIKRAIPGAMYELLEFGYNLTAFLRLRRAVAAFRPDVIYERFSLFLLAGIWVRRLSGVRLLLEINAPLFEERARNDGLKLHALGRWAQGLIWRNADFALPVTGVLAKTVMDYGVPEARIRVIHNGIDPDSFANTLPRPAAKAALGLPGGVVIGFVGFIRAWNALDRLVDFVAEQQTRHDLHLLVVGDGPARAALAAQAMARGVTERITLTGLVERADIARHLAAMDIAVLPGITPYSSPLKLFEYMIMGCAIVAPDSENIREILTDGEDALLFDPTDPTAMAACVQRLLVNAQLRAQLGEAAQARIQSAGLTWARNAERVVALARSHQRPQG